MNIVRHGFAVTLLFHHRVSFTIGSDLQVIVLKNFPITAGSWGVDRGSHSHASASIKKLWQQKPSLTGHWSSCTITSTISTRNIHWWENRGKEGEQRADLTLVESEPVPLVGSIRVSYSEGLLTHLLLTPYVRPLTYLSMSHPWNPCWCCCNTRKIMRDFKNWPVRLINWLNSIQNLFSTPTRPEANGSQLEHLWVKWPSLPQGNQHVWTHSSLHNLFLMTVCLQAGASASGCQEKWSAHHICHILSLRWPGVATFALMPWEVGGILFKERCITKED